MNGESPGPSPAEPASLSPRVRPLGPPQSVPVYTCRAYVRRLADGNIAASAANLPECRGGGASEREALAQLVGEFKAALARHQAAGTPIPWVAPPPPAPGESERLIAVHL